MRSGKEIYRAWMAGERLTDEKDIEALGAFRIHQREMVTIKLTPGQIARINRWRTRGEAVKSHEGPSVWDALLQSNFGAVSVGRDWGTTTYDITTKRPWTTKRDTLNELQDRAQRINSTDMQVALDELRERGYFTFRVPRSISEVIVKVIKGKLTRRR